MIVLPTSAIQLGFAFLMLLFLAWRFFVTYKKTGSLYAKCLGYMLLLVTLPILYPFSIALFLSFGFDDARSIGRFVTPSIAGLQYFGLGFGAMAASFYYFPKLSPKYAYALVLILGAVETLYSLSFAQEPNMKPLGVIDWHMNNISIILYNIINGLGTIPLVIAFLQKSFAAKVYFRAAMLFFGSLLVVSFAPLPHQTIEFLPFVLYSILTNAGLFLMFGGFLLQIGVQQRLTKEPSVV